MKPKPLYRLVLILFIIAAGILSPHASVLAGDSVYDTAVDYWDFDTGSGSTAADQGSNGNTVTLSDQSMWITSGQINGAVDFNGINQSAVNLSAPGGAPNGSVSFALWIYPEQLPTSEYAQTLYSSYSTNVQPWGDLCIDIIGSKFELARNLGNDYKVQKSASDLTSNTWTHVVATYDNVTGLYSIYLNGELDSSGYAGAGDISGNLNYLRIGKTGHPSDLFFYNGKIDEFAIWNTVLTESEIQALYETAFVSSGMEDLSLSYTTDELNQLAYLYGVSKSGTLSIDGITWSYVAGALPGDNNYAIGTGWIYDGDYYIKLGSGLKGEPGGAVPEPATVVMLLAGGLMGGVRMLRKKNGRQAGAIKVSDENKT